MPWPYTSFYTRFIAAVSWGTPGLEMYEAPLFRGTDALEALPAL